MTHKVFEKSIPVHFGDCDPAGIVYHPSYYRLLNELHEDFLHAVAGIGFIEIRRYGVGFPVVGVRTDFAAPSFPGDELTGRVWVERMGRTSVRLAFTLHGRDRSGAPELRLQCAETMVCVTQDASTGGFVKTPVPEAVREAFAPYLLEAGEPELQLRA